MVTNRKATNEQIAASYAETKSVWKTAAAFGMCGQSVQERLVKLGIARTGSRPLTTDEREAIRRLYESSFERGARAVDELAAKLGRTVGVIYTFACEQGWTEASRKPTRLSTAKAIAGSVAAIKAAQRNGTYKNSMSGTTVPMERREKMRKSSVAMWQNRSKAERSEIITRAIRTKIEKYGHSGNRLRVNTTWKSGWREIGGVRIYARSRWEANYARYLEFLKSQNQIELWEHEPETFWFPNIKRGSRVYLPDFRVTVGGKIEYHEVKGWMDARSKTKLRRMKIFHPTVVLKVIGKDWFKKNTPSLRNSIEGWEGDTP